MEEAITEDALLQSNKGSSTSSLSVTSQQFFSIENKLIATEKDKQSVQNIKPFGVCKLKPTSGGYLPCMPAPTQWEETSAKNKVNDVLLLLKTSICSCSVGGTISVQDKGYIGNTASD